MASFAVLEQLHAVAPEKQQLLQQPLTGALKLSHHPFHRRNTSPELPQDSNTDALDENDVLESSMTADSAIACTPPLSVADSTDDVDDLFSPLSPPVPLHYHHNRYDLHSYPASNAPSLAAPQYSKSHPFDTVERGLLSLPDKSHVVQRLQAVSTGLTSPIPMATTPPPPILKSETIGNTQNRRPTVSFDIGQDDDSEVEEEESELNSPVSSPSPLVSLGTAESATLPSIPCSPGKKSDNEEKVHKNAKGVDAIQHDLASLDLESRDPRATTAPSTTTTPLKNTDDLLGHILVEQAPSDMLVALFDRPTEMQALVARNSDFFKVLYTQIDSASLANFKQVLFSSREEKCDAVWMQELASHLKEQPCVLEKFKSLVGWVGPDDDDDDEHSGSGSDRADDDDDYELWGEDEHCYRSSSYEQIQIKWIRDYPEQLAAFPKEYPQFFINAREQLQGKRLSFGGDRRDLYEIFYETLFLTRDQLRCDNAWTRRMNACLEKHPDLLLQLKEIIAYEIGWDD
ncbi:hypothetical protein BGW41_001069 [Actinomortierella wolfii]|nr:hypothetical protein BGW41_001069 [Actinomortierella wolfii]